MNQIFDNIYLLVIGKLFSATDLGFFTRAKTLEELPSQTLSGMVGRVTFPVFSTIQDDPARLKRGMKKALTTLVLVNFPMMIGLAVIARPLVLVLLTEKWAECIPYLQLLCFVGLLYPAARDQFECIAGLGAVRTFSAPGDYQEGSDRHQHRRHLAVGHIRDDLRYDCHVNHLLLFEQLLHRSSDRLPDPGAVA